MSIEYMLDLGCKVKRALGVETLGSLLKQHGQADAIVAMLREQGDTRDPSQVTIRAIRMGPKGPEEREVTVDELRAAGAHLAKWEHECTGCPGRVRDAAFGCYGAISYPIEIATEEWLLSLLPDHLDTTAGEFLVKAVNDFGYDGAPVEELRHRPEMFASSETAGIRWGDDDDAFSVTTNQLLQMFFFVGAIQPSHATMLSLFVGSIPHDVAPQRFATAIGDPKLLSTLFARPSSAGGGWRNSPVPGSRETAQIGQFRELLAALRVATILDTAILVDA